MSRAAYDPVTDTVYVQLTFIDYLAPALLLVSAALWLVVVVLLLLQ